MKSRIKYGVKVRTVESKSCGRKFDSTRQRNQPTTRSGLRTFFGSSLPDLAALDLFSPVSHLRRSFHQSSSPYFRSISSPTTHNHHVLRFPRISANLPYIDLS